MPRKTAGSRRNQPPKDGEGQSGSHLQPPQEHQPQNDPQGSAQQHSDCRQQPQRETRELQRPATERKLQEIQPSNSEAPKDWTKQAPSLSAFDPLSLSFRPERPKKQDQESEKSDRGDVIEVGSIEGKQPTDDLPDSMQDMVISPREKIDQRDKPGRRMIVETNHLTITFKEKYVTAYHYDVTFQPDTPEYLIKPAWNEFARRFFPGRFPSFDGRKNVYSNGAFPIIEEGNMSENIEIYDEENDRNTQCNISIKFVNKINLSSVTAYGERGSRYPHGAVNVIETVLRNLPANRLIQWGRLFFSPPEGEIVSLGKGLDMWYGFRPSVILGRKPYLKVDLVYKGFPTPCDLLETLKSICGWDGKSELDKSQFEDFRSYIQGLKVEYQIPNVLSSKRAYKVNDILGSATFTLDNGDRTTVAENFKTENNCELHYPYLPWLWVGKKTCVPLELCKVVEGEAYVEELSEEQIAIVADGTDVRKQRIMKLIEKADYGTSPFAQEFGISVAGEFEKVEARVLDPPKLQYGQDIIQSPENGVWSSSPFFKAAELKDWCILSLDYEMRGKLSELENMLVETARGLNMNPSNPKRSLCLDPRSDVEKVYRDLLGENIRIVFAVLPEGHDPFLRVIQNSELRVGILTQCIKSSTVSEKLTPFIVNHILLKVNAKLNGVNLTLNESTRPECFERPVLIVGAVMDTISDDKDVPSVAAVSACHDANCFQYNMATRLQDPKDETIPDLENIIKDQLLFYYRRTNKLKPEKIIFFREGISNGQVNKVFKVELQAIRRACAALQSDYKPALTFVLVDRRHHTRFFPDKRDCDEEKNKFLNVPPGTCVDTDIVDPRETNFYLTSHAGILGTSRATKYSLIWDDSDVSESELQKLTYHLCHLIAPCTSSVSSPAPIYYAHCAASRGCLYLNDGEEIDLNSLDEEQKRRQVHSNLRENLPMHFF